MPRAERIKSKTGIYHVMLRGINGQVIFNDEEDYDKYIEAIEQSKAVSDNEIYAYCLMNNHIHLLIKEGKETIGEFMKRISVRYVYWYNWKYYRRGSLFQDRFKSEPINEEKYYLTVLRYIHQNPIKAGLVSGVEEYQYSSYNEYVDENKIIDSKYTYSIMSKDGFIEYHKEISDEKCMDCDNIKMRINDREVKELIYKMSKCDSAEDFMLLDKKERDRYIKRLRKKGISIRQISRMTGISKGIVEKIK